MLNKSLVEGLIGLKLYMLKNTVIFVNEYNTIKYFKKPSLVQLL